MHSIRCMRVCTCLSRLRSSGWSTTTHCTVGLFHCHLAHCTNDQISILPRWGCVELNYQIRNLNKFRSLSCQIIFRKQKTTHLTLQSLQRIFFLRWKLHTEVFHESVQDILGHDSKEVTIEIFPFSSPDIPPLTVAPSLTIMADGECRRRCTWIPSLSPVLRLLNGLDDFLTE